MQFLFFCWSKQNSTVCDFQLCLRVLQGLFDHEAPQKQLQHIWIHISVTDTRSSKGNTATQGRTRLNHEARIRRASVCSLDKVWPRRPSLCLTFLLPVTFPTFLMLHPHGSDDSLHMLVGFGRSRFTDKTQLRFNR